jgi:predicted membrane protein
MVPVTAKVIVSPSFAMASAWRNEPGPLSFVLVTVMVAARTCIAIAQSSAKEILAPTLKKLGREMDLCFITELQ